MTSKKNYINFVLREKVKQKRKNEPQKNAFFRIHRRRYHHLRRYSITTMAELLLKFLVSIK
jgi:hypothetical protein